MHRLPLVVRLLLLLIAASAFPVAATPLQAQWEFRMLPGDAQGAAHPGLQQWRAATVPGSVLLAHELIRDPYVGAPGRTAMDRPGRLGVPRPLRRGCGDAGQANAELRFDGLDTYADVSLNGKPLLRATTRTGPGARA